MRNIYILFLAVIAVGCSSQLDQLPSDKLPTDGAIETLVDLEYAVNGVYNALIDNHSYVGDFGLYADCKGGDLTFVDDPNHLQPNIIFQTDQNSEEADEYYYDFYLVLARANHVLGAAENISDKDDDMDLYNDLVGQLHGLKALIHFDLARLFAQLPSVAADMNAENSGIVISDEVFVAKDNPTFKRSTLKGTYDYIKTSLNKALPLLTKDENLGRLNYWTAMAMKARLHLYLEEYDDALAAAIAVINNTAGYRLFTRDEFLGAWSKQNQAGAAPGFIFEILVDDQTSAQRESLGYFTNPDGYAEAAATDAFKDIITANADDIRSQSVSLRADADGKLEGWYTTKYMGRPDAVAPLYVNNAKVFRMVEMYYIAAEAVLMGGTATGAESATYYYDEVRKNRIEGYVGGVAPTIDDILAERRIEFFCENHRMFDLVRHKITWEHPHVSGGTISYDDYRILVAIPQSEIEINPELEQNPDY